MEAQLKKLDLVRNIKMFSETDFKDIDILSSEQKDMGINSYFFPMYVLDSVII